MTKENNFYISNDDRRWLVSVLHLHNFKTKYAREHANNFSNCLLKIKDD